MANTKISQLTLNTNPNGGEELVYAYNNTNGKMTLNTMKAFATANTQEELVSGTNIKTINGNSILGSGNLVISGGGGSGEDNDYDAVVDVNGGGDYTSISAAITAGIKRIYVRNGTYTMSSQTLSTGDFKLVGESRNGVVINVTYPTRSGTIFTLTSDTTSEANSFLFQNLTFNIAYTGNYGYFVMFGGLGAGAGALNIDHCTINVVQADNGCNFYVSRGGTDMNSCLININASGTYTAIGYTGVGGTCVNSKIIVDADNTIGTTGLTLGANAKGEYTNCQFEIGKNRTISGDVVQLGCSYTANCSFVTSSYANIQIYGYCESCTFPNLGKDANFDSALNTAVTGKTITIWKPSTSYTVGQYVMSGNSTTLAKCIEAHTSGTSFDASKFENVYGDIYIQGTLRNCTVNAWGNVVISGVASYNNTFVQPASVSSISGSGISFSKPSGASATFANLILLSNRGFNDCRVIAYDATTTHIYLGGESAEFVGNRITSYKGDIYSGGYGNVITNNIFNYVTGQTAPTITQVTGGGSEIANNVIRGVVDWTQF